MSGQQSATLRPRNKRLISIDDDFETVETGPATSSRISAHSPFSTSRTGSPISSTLPSRSASAARAAEGTHGVSRLRDEFGTVKPASTSSIGASLWGSWTSINEIATTLLGSGTNRSWKGKRRKALPDYKSPQRSANIIPEQWGPSSDTPKPSAYGSQKDRLQRLQAKKMETLLAANGDPYPDSTGNYKRRKSEDEERYHSNSKSRMH